MFWKCSSLDVNIWPVFLVVVIFACSVQAEESTEGCKGLIIASTLGTFAACVIVSVVVIYFVYRRARRTFTGGSLRKSELEAPRSSQQNIQFENSSAICLDNDDGDSGIASPVSPVNNQDADAIKATTSEAKSTPKPTISHISTQTHHSAFARPKPQSITVEKRQNGGLGLSLATAGLYVKRIDGDPVDKHHGSIEPGDEIVSINGVAVEGMTDMEALALVAKAGPNVQLQVVKNAFLWKVLEAQSRHSQKDLRKRNPHSSQSSQTSLCDYEALKKAKLEIGEALMELRRCTARTPKAARASGVKPHEKTSSQQSFIDSIELPPSVAEEDFVVIESAVEAQMHLQKQAVPVRVKDVTKNETVFKISSGDQEKDIIPIDASHDVSLELAKQVKNENTHPVHIPVVTPPQNVLQATKPVSNGIKDSSNMISAKPNGTDCLLNDVKTHNPKLLTLPLKAPFVHQQRTSPKEERAGYPVLKDISNIGSTQRGSSLELHGPAYVITENDQPASSLYYSTDEETCYVPNTAASYVPDLDKIKPPPSYEVASLTFNAQKRGFPGGSAAGTPTESRIPMVEQAQMNSMDDSTNSSFDDLDAAVPIFYSKSLSRESVSIDEHVMRYMNKKYSEPRFPTTLSNASLPPAVNMNSPNARFNEPDISRARSGSDLTDFPQTRPNDFLRKSPNDVINSYSCTSIISPAAISELHVEDAQNSLYAEREHSDPFDNFELNFRRNPNRVTNSLTDISRESSSSFENQAIPIAGNIPKNVFNRPNRQLRSKILFGDSMKNIRRAASSPSVNADHHRGSSNESYSIDPQSVPRRTRTQRASKSKGESFDRRKSIDSGSLRKLAAELQSNQSLSDNLPMLSRLLGGLEIPDAGKSNNLYRFYSNDDVILK